MREAFYVLLGATLVAFMSWVISLASAPVIACAAFILLAVGFAVTGPVVDAWETRR